MCKRFPGAIKIDCDECAFAACCNPDINALLQSMIEGGGNNEH